MSSERAKKIEAALRRLVIVCNGMGWLRNKSDALAEAETALTPDPALTQDEIDLARAYINLARDQWADDECEIDDLDDDAEAVAAVSIGSDLGAWVKAWIWVIDDDVGLEEDEFGGQS